jgi:hypothetical protein
MSIITRAKLGMAFPRTLLKPAQPIRQKRKDPGQPRVHPNGVVPKPAKPVPTQE